MEFLSEIIYRERFIIENGFHSRDAIIIVLEGTFQCTIMGKRYTATPGDIYIFPANTQFQRNVLQPIRCIYFQFEPFPIPLSPGPLETGDEERTRNTIHHLARAVAQENQELTIHFLQDLLLLHRYRKAEGNQIDEIVSGCIAYFSRNLGKKVTLEMVAKEFSLSKQGLIQKFRKHTGKTPMEYLSNLRLNHSKQLLTDTTLSIGEIALQCGFENVYYFSNHFKRATGLSPTSYRKLMSL